MLEQKTKGHALGVFLITLSILIITTIVWGNRTFSPQTIAQLVFQLKVPLDGADINIYLGWFFWCLPPALIVPFVTSVSSNTGRLLSVRTIKGLARNGFTWLGTACLACSLAFTTVNYDVYGYIKSTVLKTDLYERYYVDPATADIAFPEVKRNLIHIYLESMENTYASAAAGGAYEQGYMPELEALAEEYTSFSNTASLGGSITLNGTQWTIAAMVAQDAGIPLLLPLDATSYGKYSSFLPGAYTIGQVLESAGYNQELLIGSKSDFGATYNFFSQHGNYTIKDYTQAQSSGRIPNDYKVFWGYEDKKLLTFAKEDILTLAAGDQPFNMTIATIDPHTPNGFLDATCPRLYPKQYENVIACQSSKIAEFVSWIQQQDFYENTTIVITGDHPSMNSTFFVGLDPNYIRTPYNVIINSPAQPVNEKQRTFTTMDWYPTILAAMGVTIEGDRLGLGTNLFSDRPTIAEERSLDYFQSEAQKTSDFYNTQLLGLPPDNK